MPPNLHLKIFTTHVHEATVGQPITMIAGQINARVSPLWVRQKFAACKIWLAPIAKGKIRASHGNFADLVHPHCRPVFIQQQNFVTLQGIADGDSLSFNFSLLIYKVIRNCLGFADAVPVNEYALV